MDSLLAIIILLLAGLMGLAAFIIKIKSKLAGGNKSDFSQKSPYEKYLAEKTASWEVGWQMKQIFKHKTHLREALVHGDKTAAKIQRSMLVFGKSVVNHFQKTFKA